MDLSKETTAPKTATHTPKGEPWAVPVGEETDVNGKPAPSGREGPCTPREGAEEAGPPPPCWGSPRSPVRCVLAFLRDRTRASGRAPIHPSGCWGSCESSASSRIGRSWRQDQKGEASRGFQRLPGASRSFRGLPAASSAVSARTGDSGWGGGKPELRSWVYYCYYLF